MPRRTSAVQRRHFLADRCSQIGFVAMRPCSYCVSRDYLCVMSAASEHCEQCIRKHRHCELAPPADGEFERLAAQERHLTEEALAAEAKAMRLRKQRRLVRKKLRDLGDKEMQNILDLEMEEALAEMPPLEPLPGPPLPSPSQVSQGSPGRTPASPPRSG
jgi:hypothetical protein